MELMDGLEAESLTHCRHERKLVLAPRDAAELERSLESELGLTPGQEAQVTSIYFDVADGRLAAAALASPSVCLKVRLKEYDPDFGAPPVPRCVIELKHRNGSLTRKLRYWVPRSEVAGILGVRNVALSWPSEPARMALRSFNAPLKPVVAVTYLRRVFMNGDTLRVTFDRELSFHSAPEAIVLGAERVLRSRLPPPFAREARVIVEVKHLGDRAPEWANPLLARHENTFSKFGAALHLLSRQCCRRGNEAHAQEA